MPNNRIYGISRFGEGPESFDRRMKEELRRLLKEEPVKPWPPKTYGRIVLPHYGKGWNR